MSSGERKIAEKQDKHSIRMLHTLIRINCLIMLPLF